ncbi:hypothetical protein GSUB_13395 [Geoalkalibacter subterraneus]|uniref:Lipoprotein n=2 Tax=Geoalkalibacter subterraneus TaxID=483547 RepID=A0A0B5FRS3_9BACT|nr:hypothetical protein GSUB_13395 [Geoalkalibacter subterraneus]
MNMSWLFKFTALLILSSLCGCAGQRMPQTRMSAMAETDICRIAIMPFENRTRDDRAATMAYRVLMAELIGSGQLEVEPEGDVGLFRLRHRLFPGERLLPDQYADLARQMKVDAIVRGRITDIGYDSSRGERDIPYIALQLDLFDVRRGHPVLNTIHRRYGDEYRKMMHFGVITTTTGLMARMSQEIIADWSEKGVGNCP